jgi:hypothetical protein
MNRFSEGKACDAVIRHIEAREGNARQDVRSPEQQGDVAPVEISCSIGGQLFVFEHTGIEPFEGQIEIEAQGHFKPLKDLFDGCVPQNEQYKLYVPAGATNGLPKARLKVIISALEGWIQSEVLNLQPAPLGRYGTPAARKPDSIIPFEVALRRNSLPGRGHLSIVHSVDRFEDSRSARIERACKKKFPKLAVWKARGARTVLILEAVDDQLTNPVDVAKEVLRAEETIGNRPDEIYFVFSPIVPWFVWHIRVDTRSFFDLRNPDERMWEADPRTLVPLTNR